MKIKRPYFLGIGANKSATTWLSKILRRHPRIYIPYLKEIHYFDRSPDYLSPSISSRESDGWWRRAHRIYLQTENKKKKRWLEKYLFGTYNDAWYLSLFDNAEDQSRCGEVTPAYSLLNISDIQKIYKLNPDLKIIFIMRDPVERAWSGFLHFLKIRDKNYDELGDSEIIEHLKSAKSTLRGDYLSTIQNWTSVFLHHQFYTILFDDIVSDPKVVIDKVLSFLSLNQPFNKEIDFRKKENKGLGIEMPDKFRNLLHEMYDDKSGELYKKLNNPIIKSWMKLSAGK